MKKLGKLNVNPQNTLNSEELLKLKGGDTEYCCMCYKNGTPMGYMLATQESECNTFCSQAFGDGGSGIWYC